MVKRVKKNRNKGFSLIEILIAISILAVISLTIVTFMGTSSETYTRGSTEATMQSEVQIVANAISDRMIDCNDNIDYNLNVFDQINGLSADTSRYGDDQDGYILQISNDLERYAFVLDRTDGIIYFLESARTNKSAAFPQYEYSQKQVLAQHVENFVVKKDRYADDHIIWFELTYHKNKKSYTGQYQVNIRNHITLDQGSTVEVVTPETIQSITVTPPVTYIHMINSVPKSTTNQPISDLTFTASVKPSSVGQDVEWVVLGDDQSLTFKPEDKGNNPAKLTIEQNGAAYSEHEFKVVATKEGVQGSADVYIREVRAVNINPVSGLSASTASTGVTSYTAPRGGTVVLNGLVEGWHLGTANKKVSWIVQYKQGVSGNWQNLNNTSIATAVQSGTTCSLVLGSGATTNTYFRLTATSTFDDTKHDTIEFGVRSSQDTNGNKTFARGVDLDLASYFAAYGVEGWILDEFISATVSNVPNLDANSADVFVITPEGKLYVDYEAANLKYYGNRLKLFYQSLTADIVVTFRGWASNYTDYGVHTITAHVTLPAVEVYKTNAALTSKVHAWNGASTQERSELVGADPSNDLNAIKNAMRGLNQTDSNIILAKGNSKAANLWIQSYNIIKPEVIGIFVEDGSSNFGTNIGAAGNPGGNAYFTASLTSSTGTRTKLQDTGVITFKANSRNKVPFYPTGKIKVNVGVKDFYLIDKDQASFTSYNVYIANVEGTSVFIPGPDSDEWKNGNYGTSGTNVTVGPANTTVMIYRLSNGSYQLKYNNAYYIYNTTYHYWAEK